MDALATNKNFEQKEVINTLIVKLNQKIRKYRTTCFIYYYLITEVQKVYIQLKIKTPVKTQLFPSTASAYVAGFFSDMRLM